MFEWWRLGWQTFSVLLPEGLSSFVTGFLFFFRHRKKKQERCHRSESVDDGLGALPPTPPPQIHGRPSRHRLLPALPCRPGERFSHCGQVGSVAAAWVLMVTLSFWEKLCFTLFCAISGRKVLPIYRLLPVWKSKSGRKVSFYLNSFAAGCGTFPRPAG